LLDEKYSQSWNLAYDLMFRAAGIIARFPADVDFLILVFPKGQTCSAKFSIADYNPGIRHVYVERFARTTPNELSGTCGVTDRKVHRNFGAPHFYQQNKYKLNKTVPGSNVLVYFFTYASYINLS